MGAGAAGHRRRAASAERAEARRTSRRPARHADDRRRRRRERRRHPAAPAAALYGRYACGGSITPPSARSRTPARPAAARAAADARAPALPGRLADAASTASRATRSSADARTACWTSTIDPKLAWALRHRERFPVDVNTRRARDAAARAGPRRERGRPHARARAAHGTLRLEDVAPADGVADAGSGPSSSPPTGAPAPLLDARRSAPRSLAPQPPPQLSAVRR